MNKKQTNYPQAFNHPPLFFRSLNAVWKNTYFLGTKTRLDKDELIKSAKKITGLHDLGKDFDDEPLEKLLISVKEEAKLHPVGRFITRRRFISLLSIRLRAEYFFRKYPEILDQELYPAWIIIGLQRTGTTKLQRLLAVDSEHRVIPSWEVINPLPLNVSQFDRFHQKDEIDPARLKMARLSVNALKIMSPGFFAIHPIDVYQPEEDILLLDVSFMSTTPEAMMQVPTYAEWLEKTDQSQAYAYMVKLLKFMQWSNPAKRWILKSPHHLEFPNLIEKNFGKVRFIWPHRTIYESVPSFLSMVTYNHMIFSDNVDAEKIGRHWIRKTGYILEKALDYRKLDGKQEKFTDIYYQDLVKESFGELSKIYSYNGGIPEELKNRFEHHEREHPYRKHGNHDYVLSDFNLTTDDIDNYTLHYQEFMNEHYGK
jgi:hypothetical protein